MGLFSDGASSNLEGDVAVRALSLGSPSPVDLGLGLLGLNVQLFCLDERHYQVTGLSEVGKGSFIEVSQYLVVV